ncbi:hypothetical protein ACNKHT_03990 [Shigella flexneri]
MSHHNLMAGICRLNAHPELGNNHSWPASPGDHGSCEIEPLVPWGELTMPVPGLETSPPGLKRVWDVSRYGVAILD